MSSPERYIPDFAKAGADIIIVHVETCPHLHRTVQQIRAEGKGVGVALNPATPLVALEEILEYIDMALIMTVNPGFGGQEFIYSMLPENQPPARQHPASAALRCDIEVDGGIHEATIRQAVEAGANLLVAGSAVYGSPDGVQAAMQRLRSAIERNS